MDLAYATKSNDSGSRERLAWAVLLTSFIVWVVLIVALPIGVTSILHNATRPMVLSVQANEGTVGLARDQGQRDAIFVGEPARSVEGRASILTSTTDTAHISVYPPENEQVLARIQVYANTGLDILSARTPRFNLSANSNELALNLNSGRLRISLPEHSGRPTVVRISVPQQGEVVLEQAGQYSFEVSNAATSVVVLEGEATVTGPAAELTLQANERGLIPAEGTISGPLNSERNLVRNGDFSDGMRGWTPSAWEADLPERGSTDVLQVEGDTVLRFHRVGQGHADADLRQLIAQDVTDFESLELYVTMRIAGQSLGVCGVQGSECPLFVRIVYDDVHGAEQTWQQGFYAVGEIVAGSTPDICQFCAAPRNPHVRVLLNQIDFFESGNLLERLAEQNIKPRFIKSISIAASGHSFETQVLEVGLIANE